MEKKRQEEINKFSKQGKPTTAPKTVIVYCKETPVVYGNLTIFCLDHNLSYSETVKKGFPFEHDGYTVHKVKSKNGTIDNYICNRLRKALKGVINHDGIHTIKFKDELIDEIYTKIKCEDVKIKVLDYHFKDKTGNHIRTSLTKEKLEYNLNR